MNLFKSLMLVAATAAVTVPAIASADDWGHRDFRRDGYREVVYRHADWDYIHECARVGEGGLVGGWVGRWV